MVKSIKQLFAFSLFALLSFFSLFANSATFNADRVYSVYQRSSSGVITCNSTSITTIAGFLAISPSCNPVVLTTPYLSSLCNNSIVVAEARACTTRYFLQETNNYKCPTNTSLTATTCTPNSGYSAVNNNGTWSVVPTGSECTSPKVYNSTNGLCQDPPKPTCTADQELINGQCVAKCTSGPMGQTVRDSSTGLCTYPPASSGCLLPVGYEDWFTGPYPPGSVMPATKVFRGCNFVCAIPDGNGNCKSACVGTPDGYSCGSWYTVGVIPPEWQPPAERPSDDSTSAPDSSSPTNRLNTDGSLDYDGNPSTSGTNEPGRPGSNLNLDGSPNTDGNPLTNNDPPQEPCQGFRCEEQQDQGTCTPESSTWNPETQNCGSSGSSLITGDNDLGYTKGESTIATVLTDFNQNLNQTPIFQAANSFFGLGISSVQCPVFEHHIMQGFLGQQGFVIRVDQHCSDFADDVFPIMEAVLMAVASFVAFRWAVL